MCSVPIFLFLSVETMVRTTINKIFDKNYPEVLKQLSDNDVARYARVKVLQEKKKITYFYCIIRNYLSSCGWVKIYFLETDLKSGRVQYLIRDDYNLDIIIREPEPEK